MLELTFAEQVKIVLGRKGMTIKQLAEEIEFKTGMKMSRQNLTQRLGRDNFQELDMKMIAEILECPYKLSILEGMEEETFSTGEQVAEIDLGRKSEIREIFHEEVFSKEEESTKSQKNEAELEKIKELEKIAEQEKIEEQKKIEELEKQAEQKKRAEQEKIKELEELAELEKLEAAETEVKVEQESEEAQEVEPAEPVIGKPDMEAYEPIKAEYEKEVTIEQLGEEIASQSAQSMEGEINPYSGYEYKTNSVRTHPQKLGYVQVYNRDTHDWTEMTEWAFFGYQERQQLALGKAYVEPTYLD